MKADKKQIKGTPHHSKAFQECLKNSPYADTCSHLTANRLNNSRTGPFDPSPPPPPSLSCARWLGKSTMFGSCNRKETRRRSSLRHSTGNKLRQEKDPSRSAICHGSNGSSKCVFLCPPQSAHTSLTRLSLPHPGKKKSPRTQTQTQKRYEAKPTELKSYHIKPTKSNQTSARSLQTVLPTAK